MKNIFKITVIGFLLALTGVIVIASDIIVKQGNLNIADLTATGKAGIGTTNPSAQLHVNRITEGWTARIENSHTGGADSGLLIRAGDGADDTALSVQNRGGTKTLLKITSDGKIGLSTGIVANKALCLKADKTIGTCSNAVSSTGTCTCA
ncbi:MAG: hypothetical protein AABX29_08295 [Nanoarchaeota archaeon]